MNANELITGKRYYVDGSKTTSGIFVKIDDGVCFDNIWNKGLYLLDELQCLWFCDNDYNGYSEY